MDDGDEASREQRPRARSAWNVTRITGFRTP